MNYKMYDEMMEQPDSLRRTFASEMSKMDSVSEAVSKADKIYLIGCGSSISTCYSVRDALRMSCDMSVEVFTGYEFYYNKKLTDGENSIAIFTSQSGETADTLASLKRANEYGIHTVSISNEPDSSMIKEAKTPIITQCERETAILGTKTYVTQLACLYQILFKGSNYDNADELLGDLKHIPDIIEVLLKTTEEDNKKLAEEFKDEDIFYPENITDVTHNSVLALSIFLGILKRENITQIVAVDYLPLRYQSKQEANIRKVNLLKVIYNEQEIENKISDFNDIQNINQNNMTNKFIRTFNRVNYHLNNLNILAFPGEIDNSMHIKINDNRIENHHLINTVYNEIAFAEEKRKK